MEAASDVEKARIIPFQQWGGSAKYARKLADQLPEHQRYVEPFCGAAAVFFAKPRAPEEVVTLEDEGSGGSDGGPVDEEVDQAGALGHQERPAEDVIGEDSHRLPSFSSGSVFLIWSGFTWYLV